ncbi:MAG: 3'-5' exonuclease [Pseudomonadaceae bacterium]|nr:MAG: 3'-5' exonuclease [Pseudomonadaceae bacterium]
MNMLTWLPRRRPLLTTQQLARREPVQSAPQPAEHLLLQHDRLIVLDLETSGLNVYRDQVLSIGAVAIEFNAIDMGQQFECTLFRPGHKVTEAVLLHGIAPSEIALGRAAADGLLDFLEFAQSSPVFAFHAPFDQRMLSRSLRQDVGMRLQLSFIDVAEMAPMLCPDASVGRGGLDDWLRHFNLNNSERHNAAADAQATAELLLILLSKASQQGIQTLSELTTRLGHWRRLQQSRAV